MLLNDQDAQMLLNKLIGYARPVGCTTSAESNHILMVMRDSLEMIDASNDPNKIQQKTAILIGGIIAVLKGEDNKYHYTLLYPCKSGQWLFEQFYNQDLKTYIANIGRAALQDPAMLTKEILSIEAPLINLTQAQLAPVFPRLKECADEMMSLLAYVRHNNAIPYLSLVDQPFLDGEIMKIETTRDAMNTAKRNRALFKQMHGIDKAKEHALNNDANDPKPHKLVIDRQDNVIIYCDKYAAKRFNFFATNTANRQSLQSVTVESWNASKKQSRIVGRNLR